jgi:hypothetical protein
VCRGYELHADLAARSLTCWSEVGFLALELADPARAIAALTRAARWQVGTERPMHTGYLALARGEPAVAVKLFGDALAAFEREPVVGWWSRLIAGELRLGLGRAQRALGLSREARATLAAGIADLDAVVRDHPHAAYERRLRRARSELAAI